MERRWQAVRGGVSRHPTRVPSVWHCRMVLGSGSFTDTGLPLLWIFRRTLDLEEWSSWGRGALLAGISCCLQGDSDLGGKRSKGPALQRKPLRGSLQAAVSLPSLRVRSERNAAPLSGPCRARSRPLASSLGASRPDCLHGPFSGTAEVDVTRVLDQGTHLPSCPCSPHGQVRPLHLLGESERGGCGAVV